MWSVTYASARNFLAAHPEVVRHEDTAEGSAWFTYTDTDGTLRQVYFEDEFSVAAKYDYAIATGLAGVGTWTLDNDRGYTQLSDVIRAKFYDPTHRVTVGAQVTKVALSAGTVKVTHVKRVKNVGNVPERGTLVWRVYDPGGRLVKKGSLTLTLYPGKTRTITTTTALGTPSALRAGTYKLKVQFVSSFGTWKTPVDGFRQPY